jgi:hypothetical protein
MAQDKMTDRPSFMGAEVFADPVGDPYRVTTAAVFPSAGSATTRRQPMPAPKDPFDLSGLIGHACLPVEQLAKLER